jgi:hypothetical protein
MLATMREVPMPMPLLLLLLLLQSLGGHDSHEA